MEEVSNKYDIISMLYNMNSLNGICLDNKNEKMFFKVALIEDIENDIEGYMKAISYLPHALLIETFRAGAFGALIFLYEESIKYNGGLLFDVINNTNVELTQFKIIFDIIMEKYTHTFKCKVTCTDTLEKVSTAFDKFIIKRLDDRLMKWYGNSSIKVVGKDFSFTLKDIAYELYLYLKKYRPKSNIFSPIAILINNGIVFIGK